MELIANDLGSLLCRPRTVISRYCSVMLGPSASAVVKGTWCSSSWEDALTGSLSGENE